jgi:uncharacterized protein (TIGR02246 family)
MPGSIAVRSWLAPLLLVVTSCAPAEPAAAPAGLSDVDRAAIEEVTAEFTRHARAGDFAAVAALYTPDAVLMSPNAPSAVGRAAIQAALEAFPPLSEFELTSVSVDGSGDVAYVQGTYRLTMTLPDSSSVTDTGKFIEIRRRQADGRWLLSHDIFNSDLPLPTP